MSQTPFCVPIDTFVPKALALALGKSAAGLPGYVGDEPTGFQCPDDD